MMQILSRDTPARAGRAAAAGVPYGAGDSRAPAGAAVAS